MDTTEIQQAALSGLREDRGLAPGDVTIVRVRQVGDDAVVAVSFDGRTGDPVRGFVGLRRLEDGRWRDCAGWSSGVRDVAPEALWTNRGGWQNASRGVHGGWVNDPAAVAVRITTVDGQGVEDVVDDGVAILVWQGALPTRDAVVDLLDHDGRVLRTAPMQSVHPRT